MSEVLILKRKLYDSVTSDHLARLASEGWNLTEAYRAQVDGEDGHCFKFERKDGPSAVDDYGIPVPVHNEDDEDKAFQELVEAIKNIQR